MHSGILLHNLIRALSIINFKDQWSHFDMVCRANDAEEKNIRGSF